MTRSTLLLFPALICFSFVMPVHAQEKPAPAKTEKKVEKKEEKKEEKKTEKKEEKSVDLRKPQKVEAQSAQAGPTGPTKKWIEAENKLIDKLNDKDKESIFILKNKYSMIQATRVVERDVGNAVKVCGDKNPGMKANMNGRFKQWQSAVMPILDTAHKQLKKDVKSQKIVDAGDLEDLMDLQDEAYEYSEKQTTKQVVSTKEACEGLLASMDRTEDNLIGILQQTLLPESAIRKRAEEAKKAEPAKAPAKKPDAKPKSE